MAYLKNYTKSKLLNDSFLCEFIEEIIPLKPGESVVRLFSEKADAVSIRGKIFTLMNGMGVKHKYTTSLTSGNLYWTLSVVKIAGGAVKSVEYYLKGGSDDGS